MTARQQKIIGTVRELMGGMHGWAVYERLPNGRRGKMIGYLETCGSETKPWHIMRNKGITGKHCYLEV